MDKGLKIEATKEKKEGVGYFFLHALRLTRNLPPRLRRQSVGRNRNGSPGSALLNNKR